ncbi:hypothetical protein ACFWOG_27620 [Kitasatospora sp. NPDC058406]|uniref:hypothetical protein n=1 Tax=Kitasatospora sp. NPDC058406 TaxID=3346483 RepID=UPI003666B6F6
MGGVAGHVAPDQGAEQAEAADDPDQGECAYERVGIHGSTFAPPPTGHEWQE